MKKLSREDLEAKAKKFVLDAYKSFSNRSGLETKWRKWDAQYNLEFDSSGKGNYEGTAKLFPPETRRALQTIVDFIIDVIFPPTSDWNRIKGIDGDADIKNAQVYKKISDIQNEKIAIRAKVIKAVYRWLKYGFLIVKVPYVYKEKYIIKEEHDRITFKGMLKSFFSGVSQKLWDGENLPEKKAVSTYDNIDFQPKSPWNMFWNYNIPWSEQKIIIEKIDNVTASHLKAQKRKGIYNDNVDEIIKTLSEQKDTGKVSDETDVDQKFPHFQNITGLNGEFSDGIAKTKLLQADCYFDIDQDGYDELCIITLALTGTKDKVDAEVIRMDLNNCELQEMPVLFVPWDELEDTSLGMGVCQIAEKDQRALNDFTNQMMDNLSEILNCVRVYDKEMIDEGQNLNTWPRKTIKVKGNPNDIVAFIRPPNIVNEAMSAVNMAKGNIQNGTRANISLQGLAARYDTTATEYTQQGSAASRGIMCQIKNFEDNILKPYLRFQYAYNLQYITRDALIGILGKTAAKAMLSTEDPAKQKSAREAIIGDYDFIPLGVTQTENKIIRGQQLINFLNIAMKVEEKNPGTVDIAFLVNKIWEVTGDGDNRILLPQNTDPALDPNDENILLSQGAELSVNPMDDDKAHAQIHLPLELIPEFMPNKMKHLKEHMMADQKKTLMAQQAGKSGPGLPAQSQPAFSPKLPMPGNNGAVPGVVKAPVNVG